MELFKTLTIPYFRKTVIQLILTKLCKFNISCINSFLEDYGSWADAFPELSHPIYHFMTYF